MRARHRLSKLLLRHSIVYYGGTAWTGAHDRWLRTEAAPQLTLPATRMAFDADYEHVLTMQTRRRRLDTAIEEMAAASEFTPIVRRMCCLRGVSTLTGFGLAVEVGDWTRFTGFRHRLVCRFGALGAFLRFVASAGIDHQNRQHPRPRLLVEAAWHHRARYRVGAGIRARWDLAPAAARARGDEGDRRLHQRWVGFLERRKRPVIANVAIARELAGWCWSLAVMDC